MTREEAINKWIIPAIKDTWNAKKCKEILEALEPEPMEKFESVKDHIFKLAGDYKCWDNRLTDDEALELYHILEQEPIDYKTQYENYLKKSEVVISQLREDRDRLQDAFDKIRSEIEQLPTTKCTETHRIYIDADDFKENVLTILDKYKAESEDR